MGHADEGEALGWEGSGTATASSSLASPAPSASPFTSARKDRRLFASIELVTLNSHALCAE